MQASSIRENYAGGQSKENQVSIEDTQDNKGKPTRTLKESETAVKTQLLDNSAPLVDIVSFLYLMNGQNGEQAKQFHNKPLYFYFNGLVRKSTLQVAGTEKITWFDQQRNAIKFNLLREVDGMGSIWIDEANGTPLKIKIGILNFSIKSN
jgi:hypothetical protein